MIDIGFAGAIAGVQTTYVILAVILIIVFAVIYAIKRMLRRSVRRGVRRSVFDSVTQETTSSQQRSSPPQKPCPDCGQSMRYINEYDKWYCDSCQEYK